MASQRRREGRERGMAAGVCVDPYSGEIVALASYPTLNPNDRKNLSNTDAVRNNALGRVFEPGSIFKPITMSIALETGATSRSTTYKCKGTMKLFDKTMSDVNKRARTRAEPRTGADELVQYRHVAESMNVPKYQAYGMLRQFGFGEESEVEMAGEEAGLIKEPGGMARHGASEHIHRSGYSGDADTAVMAIASIANGGKLLKPYVVAEVRDSTGKLIHKGERRVRYQVISKETADFVRGAMRRVVARAADA